MHHGDANGQDILLLPIALCVSGSASGLEAVLRQTEDCFPAPWSAHLCLNITIQSDRRPTQALQSENTAFMTIHLQQSPGFQDSVADKIGDKPLKHYCQPNSVQCTPISRI